MPSSGVAQDPIVDRLAAQFDGQLDRHVVEGTVATCAAQFSGRLTSDDHALAVERAARAALLSRLHAAHPQ